MRALDAALANSVNAAHLALEHLAARGKDFSDNDMPCQALEASRRTTWPLSCGSPRQREAVCAATSPTLASGWRAVRALAWRCSPAASCKASPTPYAIGAREPKQNGLLHDVGAIQCGSRPSAPARNQRGAHPARLDFVQRTGTPLCSSEQGKCCTGERDRAPAAAAAPAACFGGTRSHLRKTRPDVISEGGSTGPAVHKRVRTAHSQVTLHRDVRVMGSVVGKLLDAARLGSPRFPNPRRRRTGTGRVPARSRG
jgi:hypothetical protein